MDFNLPTINPSAPELLEAFLKKADENPGEIIGQKVLVRCDQKDTYRHLSLYAGVIIGVAWVEHVPRPAGDDWYMSKPAHGSKIEALFAISGLPDQQPDEANKAPFGFVERSRIFALL